MIIYKKMSTRYTGFEMCLPSRYASSDNGLLPETHTAQLIFAEVEKEIFRIRVLSLPFFKKVQEDGYFLSIRKMR